MLIDSMLLAMSRNACVELAAKPGFEISIGNAGEINRKFYAVQGFMLRFEVEAKPVIISLSFILLSVPSESFE